MSDYFVLYCTEDGGRVETYTKKELEVELQDEEGIFKNFNSSAAMDGEDSDFMSTICDALMSYWGYDIAIIKGSLIVPKAKEQVTVWEIE